MNDYAWDKASAIERCEILKARLDRMDRDVKAPGDDECWLPPHNWTREMVEEFNRWKPHFDVLAKAEELNRTHPAEVMVTKSELARLRRIEQAAKVAHVWLLVGGAAEANAACEKLGAALDSEPGR